MSGVVLEAPYRVGQLDENDALQGLTSMQQRFAIASFSGASDTEAYRQSYDCSGLTETQIQRNAHSVAHNPKVQAKLLELRVRRDNQTTLAPLLTRNFVINGVMNLALNATKETTQLRAYELLGKTVGIDLFRETVVRETKQRTVEDVDRELKERLSALAPLIEGEAREVAKPVDRQPRVNDRRRKPRG